MIEDLKVLVSNFLEGKLGCGLLGFVVRGERWFLGVKEPDS